MSVRKVGLFLIGAFAAIAACTSSSSDPPTTTRQSAPTTRPVLDPAAWTTASLVEVQSEAIRSSGTHNVGAGFGVPVTDDGLILTTASSVLGAARINVFVPGREFPIEAELEAAAECRDLALIDIGQTQATPVDLDAPHDAAVWSVSLRNGEPVVGEFAGTDRAPRRQHRS